MAPVQPPSPGPKPRATGLSKGDRMGLIVHETMTQQSPRDALRPLTKKCSISNGPRSADARPTRPTPFLYPPPHNYSCTVQLYMVMDDRSWTIGHGQSVLCSILCACSIIAQYSCTSCVAHVSCVRASVRAPAEYTCMEYAKKQNSQCRAPWIQIDSIR